MSKLADNIGKLLDLFLQLASKDMIPVWLAFLSFATIAVQSCRYETKLNNLKDSVDVAALEAASSGSYAQDAVEASLNNSVDLNTWKAEETASPVAFEAAKEAEEKLEQMAVTVP